MTEKETLGHPVSDKAVSCPECNQPLLQETKAPQGKKPRRLIIIVAAVAVCAIAAALFLLARPAMAVSAAISGLEGPALPPIQEIQAAKEQYDALSGLQKGFVSNSALLNQKYEERKTEDCTRRQIRLPRRFVLAALAVQPHMKMTSCVSSKILM